LALAIERQPGLGFVELNAENHDPCVPLAAPLRSSWIGVKVVVHGVSLSLGGADHHEPDLLTWMARLTTQSRGIEAGTCWPVPRTRESLSLRTAQRPSTATGWGEAAGAKPALRPVLHQKKS